MADLGYDLEVEPTVPPVGMSVKVERGIRDNCFAWAPIEGAVY